MPIPDFTKEGLLPAHNGDPANRRASSPYPVTTVELCERFGTSPERREILRGFIQLRLLMRQLEVTEGFQWVNGRFVEKDNGRRKAPDHVQVVTFYKPSPLLRHPDYAEMVKPLQNVGATRSKFAVDHSIVSLDIDDKATGRTDLNKLQTLIDHTRHYSGLLSHQAESNVWKGLLRVELNTAADDLAALERLTELERT